MEIGSENWERVIREGAHQLGVVAPDAALRGLGLHAAEMVRFNRKMNLTTITDPFEIATKHVIDSLAAGTCLPKTGTVLDIGSGGGFPGIPLKLVFPDLNVTLI
ncbi:MAG: 16S rRNA (guanine(527)-N(7))-methyltransferase RsmG, partial [Desulfobacterales bacterium]